MPAPAAGPTADRPCTCHPDDSPPVPCPQKYALAECRAATDQTPETDALVNEGESLYLEQGGALTHDQRDDLFTKAIMLSGNLERRLSAANVALEAERKEVERWKNISDENLAYVHELQIRKHDLQLRNHAKAKQLVQECKAREEAERQLGNYAPHEYYAKQREDFIRKQIGDHNLIVATEHDRLREQSRAESAEARARELEALLEAERGDRILEKGRLFAAFEEQYKKLDDDLRPKLKTANAHVRELETQIEELRQHVREWLCVDCNTVYPGPPQKGVMCVVCPKCGGSTVKRNSVAEVALLREQIAKLEAQIATARAEERERCAETCAGTFSPHASATGCCDAALDKAAAAIRALKD